MKNYNLVKNFIWKTNKINIIIFYLQSQLWRKYRGHQWREQKEIRRKLQCQDETTSISNFNMKNYHEQKQRNNNLIYDATGDYRKHWQSSFCCIPDSLYRKCIRFVCFKLTCEDFLLRSFYWRSDFSGENLLNVQLLHPLYLNVDF